MICGGIIKNDAVIYLYRLACTIFETYTIDDNFKTKHALNSIIFFQSVNNDQFRGCEKISLHWRFTMHYYS